jgi:ATP-dependent RNA helicase RhlE
MHTTSKKSRFGAKKNHSSNNQRRRSRGRGGRQRNNMGKALSPESLLSLSQPQEKSEEVQKVSFNELELHPKLHENIGRKGYEFMTEIQNLSINHIIEGKDLVGIAQTGTGKTGAFLIPLIDNMLNGPKNFKGIVLVPTRELALQVEEEFKMLARNTGLYSVTLIGGTNLGNDFKKLRRPYNLVIGTPGRVTDLIKRNALYPDKLSVLILDEFDRMLDMGFSEEVLTIAHMMENRMQTILFSATENKKLRPMLDELLFEPEFVKAKMLRNTSENVIQEILKIQKGEEKFDVLLNLLNKDEVQKVLIFSETKRSVGKLTKRLKDIGVGVDEIHGDRSQMQRKKALDKFRTGRVKVLTATDVAARGLDIDDVSHVINYQMPLTMESYIHRIGRTGRAGKKGQAITLVD